MVKRPLMRRRLSFRAVLYRDGFTCQYCRKVTRELTVDHVIPCSNGGAHLWENIGSACSPCNNRKAGLIPIEADMRLVREAPKAPHPNPYSLFQHRTILDEGGSSFHGYVR